jgi:hypothetical protein
MKTIKWEKCTRGIVGDYPLKTGQKILTPSDNVVPNMHVTAKYKKLDIHLRIIKETNPGTFCATVMYLDPVSASRPDDLFEGDEVIINRSNIGFLHVEE